jgi:hypothetical protein
MQPIFMIVMVKKDKYSLVLPAGDELLEDLATYSSMRCDGVRCEEMRRIEEAKNARQLFCAQKKGLKAPS